MMMWRGLLWGETCRWPVLPLGFVSVDGRAIIAVLPLIFHLSLDSLYIMMTGFLIFGILERFGYDIRTMIRIGKRKLGGRDMRTRSYSRMGLKGTPLFAIVIMSTFMLSSNGLAGVYIGDDVPEVNGGHSLKIPPTIRAVHGFSMTPEPIKMAPAGTGRNLPFTIMAESLVPSGWTVIDKVNLKTSWSFDGSREWDFELRKWESENTKTKCFVNIDYRRKVVELLHK